MKINTKKILGAVVCGAAMVLLWSLYAILIICFIPELPVKAKIAIAVAFVIPSVVMVGVTTERIKEIRSGVEDDLSKY